MIKTEFLEFNVFMTRTFQFLSFLFQPDAFFKSCLLQQKKIEALLCFVMISHNVTYNLFTSTLSLSRWFLSHYIFLFISFSVLSRILLYLFMCSVYIFVFLYFVTQTLFFFRLSFSLYPSLVSIFFSVTFSLFSLCHSYSLSLCILLYFAILSLRLSLYFLFFIFSFSSFCLSNSIFYFQLCSPKFFSMIEI